jgi:pseudouridine-5'-phosphate glycosidase
VQAREEMGLSGGIVVANPIAPEHAIEGELLDAWTREALSLAQAHGVHGKDVTPFLLAQLHTTSGGATEAANKELVYSNARLAAAVASALPSLTASQ